MHSTEPPFPSPVSSSPKYLHALTPSLSLLLLPQTLLPVAVLVAVVAADSEADSDPAPSPLATYAPSYYSFDHYADQGD